jgi:enoyl-CoA hydratase/carnithine racemase
MPTFLKFEQDGPIVTLTMDQPETRNALTGNDAVSEFVEAAARIVADERVKAVIVTGAGSAFSSGGNVKDMRRYSEANIPPGEIRDEYRRGIQRLPLAIYNLDIPTIAAVNGPAIGAGCDLACMCDIRIASRNAKFAESFVKLGIIPGDGGAWLLPRAVGFSKACEMAFTGDMVKSAEALACGLVSKVVPDGELMTAARALAERIAANPPHAVRMTKRLIRGGRDISLAALLELSAAMQSLAHATKDHKEAVTAFLDKRRPTFTGA